MQAAVHFVSRLQWSSVNWRGMMWSSCLLILALCGVASAQVQPPENLQSFNVGKRSVSYTFIASPTQGVTYRATFAPQRAGIPQPRTETFSSASLRTTSGLTPDVTYRLQVVAVLNGVESTPISVDFTTLPDVPTGPPQGLTVSARTLTSITLTWRDPAPDRINDRDGITSFRVKWNGQVNTVLDRTFTVTGLRAATSYDFEVLAVNEQGVAPDNHAAELTASTASGTPNPPKLVVVLPRFSQTFLQWKDPEPFVGDITGVQIRYLIDGVQQNIPELSNRETQYSVSGIKGSEGKTHSVSLRAKTSAGYGDYSDPVVFTFQPIVNVEVKATGCDTLQVKFTVNLPPNPMPNTSLPCEDNMASVYLQSLEVKSRPIIGAGGTQTKRIPLNGYPATGVKCITGLASNTPFRVTYGVEVDVSSSTVLPSDLAAPVELFTGRTCNPRNQCNDTIIAPPNPPKLVVVLPRFSQTFLQWEDPEPFVGDITGVQIRYLIDGVQQNIPELSGGVHQYSVSGIKGSEGETHSVSLRAKTSAGYGDCSDPVVFTFKPIVVCDVEPVGCDTLQVNYTVNPLPNPLPNGDNEDNEATLQFLEVTYQPSLGSGSPETRSVALRGFPAEGVLCLSGLDPDTAYNVTCSVVVDVGSLLVLPPDPAEPVEESTESNCTEQEQCIQKNSNAPSGPAQNVELKKIDSRTLEVSWEDPDPMHIKPGFEVTKYLVTVGERCGQGNKKTIDAANLVQYLVQFSDLLPGTTYCVRVVPGNDAGFASPQSVQSTDKMIFLPDILPAPDIVGVTPHDHHAIVIWKEVESEDEDNPVTHYILQLETLVGGERVVYRKVFDSSGGQYFFNMTRLAAGRLYAVTVAAKNGLGVGNTSRMSFRTLVLGDEGGSSVIPDEGHDHTAPELGEYPFTPEVDFTLPPSTTTTLEPIATIPTVNTLTADDGPIGPLLKLYEDAINNDVRGKPKYEAPVTVGEDGKKLFLCYEVQGQSNHTYNLISDSCVSVNAYYTWKSKPAKGNVVSKIGVLAVDNSGECLEIEVGLEKCTIRINGEVMRKYKAAGVNVTRHRFGRRVKIVVPNCNGVAMVMWVNCLLPGTQPKLPFKLSKGASLRSTSHGLLGQFWNVTVAAKRYSVSTNVDHIAPESNQYAVMVTKPLGEKRKFFASHIPPTRRGRCLYAGSTQGGRIYEVPSLPHSVIEGRFDEYAVTGLFGTDHKYNQFTAKCA